MWRQVEIARAGEILATAETEEATDQRRERRSEEDNDFFF
jgi:hypothetical protein